MQRLCSTYAPLLLITCVFIAGLQSCKESSLIPLDPNAKIVSLIDRKWLLYEENKGGNDDSTLSQRGWLLDLRSDGTYTTSGPTSTTSSGRWKYNESDSTITLFSPDGKPTVTFVIDSVSGTSAILKRTSSSDVLLFKIKSEPLYSVRGAVNVESGSLTTNLNNIHVLWKSLGPSDEYIVWGAGRIDPLTNTYALDFDEYPPDSVVRQFYGCSGKFGVGIIAVLNSTQQFKNGSKVNGPLVAKLAGLVQNRAVVFVFGSIANSSCSQTYPWAAWFKSGFNMGEALYTTVGTGFYRPTDLLSSPLVITDDASQLRTPNWYQ